MNKRDYNINPSMPSDKDLERFKDFDKVIDKVKATPQNPVLKVVKSKWFAGISAGVILASAAALYMYKSQPAEHDTETARVENVTAKVGEQAPGAVSTSPDDQKNRIAPPIPKWDVPYEVFDINADEGADLVSKNGSAIHIDKLSFIDEKGNTIHGKVKIRYREFHDPLGIFLSGIPMEYDTAGKACTFESAGMLELIAEKEGQDIQLGNNKKIEVDLVSLNKGDFNVYYFDTVAGEWAYTEKSRIEGYTDYTRVLDEKVVPVSEPKKPMFREQAKKKYTFSAQVDFNQFPELNKDVIFEVDDSLKAFDPLLYDVRWENITLKKSRLPGHYSVLLKKGSKEVSLEAFPVLSSAKYAEAMNLYKEQLARFESSKFEKKKFTYSQIEPEASAVQKEIAQLLRLGADQKKMYSERLNMRPILLVALGVWNIDMAKSFTESYPIALTVNPQFSNSKNDKLHTEKIYSVVGRRNALYTNGAGEAVNYSKKDKNTMWIVLPDESIGFADPADFKAIESNTHDFKMDVYSSVDGLKKIKAVLD